MSCLIYFKIFQQEKIVDEADIQQNVNNLNLGDGHVGAHYTILLLFRMYEKFV